MYKNVMLFLIAAFSMTQVRLVGYIGISELLMMVWGPWLLLMHWRELQRDGFAPFLLLVASWALSAFITDWYRETPLPTQLKGVASPLSVLFVAPCVYLLLRDDLRRIKWAILGFLVTQFLSTFVIQAGTYSGSAAVGGMTALEAALEWKLTYLMLVTSIVSLVPMLAYWQAPTLSVVLLAGLALFALWQGGRSTFLCLLLSVGLMALISGRTQRLRLVTRNLLLLFVLIMGVVVGAKWIYEDVVQRGYMGEVELRKYEEQKDSRIGLLSGRGQLVVAFYAVADSPILGHGSWPIDYEGYNQRAAEVIYRDPRIIQAAGQLSWIDTHSHVWTAWVWHGLLGGVFWFYILGLLWRTLSHRLATVPLLFGYFAYSIPQLCWAILFSPFGGRIATTVTIVTCLLVRNVERMQRQVTVVR